jgi:hypothetical protein
LARPAGILHVVPAWLLLFVYPLVLGATAVASERQMGLADWQSSLPISRARQWWVKVAVVMSLGAVGLLLASCLNGLLYTVLESRQIEADEFPGSVWISALAAAVGVYASSRAREPFRAGMAGVGLFVLTVLPAISPAAIHSRERPSERSLPGSGRRAVSRRGTRHCCASGVRLRQLPARAVALGEERGSGSTVAGSRRTSSQHRLVVALAALP